MIWYYQNDADLEKCTLPLWLCLKILNNSGSPKNITTASGLFTCLVRQTFDLDLIHVNHLLKIIIIIILLFAIITIRNLATFFTAIETTWKLLLGTIYLTNTNLMVQLRQVWMPSQKPWILHYHSDDKWLIPVDFSSNHATRGVCSVSVVENPVWAVKVFPFKTKNTVLVVKQSTQPMQ